MKKEAGARHSARLQQVTSVDYEMKARHMLEKLGLCNLSKVSPRNMRNQSSPLIAGAHYNRASPDPSRAAPNLAIMVISFLQQMLAMRSGYCLGLSIAR